MKIIDAHLHFATDAYFDEIAKAAEHENSADHLLEQYRMRGMVHGIVMGNLVGLIDSDYQGQVFAGTLRLAACFGHLRLLFDGVERGHLGAHLG